VAHVSNFLGEDDSDQEMGGNANAKLTLVPEHIRSDFIKKVYTLLTLQIGVTTMIAMPFVLFADSTWMIEHRALLQVAQLGSLAMVIGLVCCCQNMLRQYPSNYIFLSIFTVAMGIVIGFVSATYTGPSVAMAAGMTVAIFLGLTAYACTTKTDFTGMGPYLFGALLCLIIFGFVLMFVSSPLAQKIYAGLGALLFCFYIIYDTQLIVGGSHRKHEFTVDDVCFAVLTLYLDVINLFLNILSLFGGRE